MQALIAAYVEHLQLGGLSVGASSGRVRGSVEQCWFSELRVCWEAEVLEGWGGEQGWGGVYQQ